MTGNLQWRGAQDISRKTLEKTEVDVKSPYWYKTVAALKTHKGGFRQERIHSALTEQRVTQI